MRRMYEYNVWTIGSEEISDLVNNYNEQKVVSDSLMNLIITSNELQVISPYGDISFLPRQYFHIGKNGEEITGYNLVFGYWEPNLSGGGFGAGWLFGFNLFKDLETGVWSLIMYTDEL